MNIDVMSLRRAMDNYVDATSAATNNPAKRKDESAILNSISFSEMLDNALKIELRR